MGILRKLRAELIDIIEWVDDSRRTLVWRFPRYHNQIKYGARLIVRPGQVALFVHQGRIADVFEPGTYRLETRNLPVLSTLAGWKHGFESPFKAEVYFVATRQITELKWGTPHPVILKDPDFGGLRLRAFGTYTLRARDPRALLRELVGTDSSFEADEITVLMRSVIQSAFADLLANCEIGVLDLASNYQELSERLRAMVNDRIDDEYGLEVPQLFIVNISVPPEVEQALDARASMNVVGDLASYQRYQIASSTPLAAANPAGGLAGAGVGLGMGLALAQASGGAGGGLPQAPGGPGPAPGMPSAPPSAPPPAPPAAWHVAEAGRVLGPFGVAELTEAFRSGRFGPGTLVWRPGLAGWTEAGRLGELAGWFAPPPPPPARSQG